MKTVKGSFSVPDSMNRGGPIYPKEKDMEEVKEEVETSTEIKPTEKEELNDEQRNEIFGMYVREMLRRKRRRCMATKTKVTPSQKKAKRTAQRAKRRKNR
jgi:hypothetical protein